MCCFIGDLARSQIILISLWVILRWIKHLLITSRWRNLFEDSFSHSHLGSRGASTDLVGRMNDLNSWPYIDYLWLLLLERRCCRQGLLRSTVVDEWFIFEIQSIRCTWYLNKALLDTCLYLLHEIVWLIDQTITMLHLFKTIVRSSHNWTSYPTINATCSWKTYTPFSIWQESFGYLNIW